MRVIPTGVDLAAYRVKTADVAMPTRPVRVAIEGTNQVDAEWTVTEGDTPARESRPVVDGFVEVEVGSAPVFLEPAGGGS